MRFSLKTLLAFTALLAVTVTSLMYPAPLVASIFATFACATVLFSVVAAIQLTGHRRAFCMSFAIIAGSYLWMTTPSTQDRWLLQLQQKGQSSTAIEPTDHLVTTALLRTAFTHFHSRNVPNSSTDLGTRSTGGRIASDTPFDVPMIIAASPYSRSATGDWLSFLIVGESFFSFVCGLMGGALGHALYSRRLCNESSASRGA